jgi:hypothetical protein
LHDGNDHRSRDSGDSGTNVDKNPKALCDRCYACIVFQQSIYTSVQTVVAPTWSQCGPSAVPVRSQYGPSIQIEVVRTWPANTSRSWPTDLLCTSSVKGRGSVLFRPPIRYRFPCITDSLLACRFKFQPPKHIRQTDRREHKRVDPTLRGAAWESLALVQL